MKAFVSYAYTDPKDKILKEIVTEEQEEDEFNESQRVLLPPITETSNNFGFQPSKDTRDDEALSP